MNARCEGSGKPVPNAAGISHLGSKFFGKRAGNCSVCGRSVITRKGTNLANPHKPV